MLNGPGYGFPNDRAHTSANEIKIHDTQDDIPAVQLPFKNLDGIFLSRPDMGSRDLVTVFLNRLELKKVLRRQICKQLVFCAFIQ